MPPKEPLLTSPLPGRPWQKVAADLFELNKTQYLIVIDHFSRYPEVVKISILKQRDQMIPDLQKARTAKGRTR